MQHFTGAAGREHRSCIGPVAVVAFARVGPVVADNFADSPVAYWRDSLEEDRPDKGDRGRIGFDTVEADNFARDPLGVDNCQLVPNLGASDDLVARGNCQAGDW